MAKTQLKKNSKSSLKNNVTKKEKAEIKIKDLPKLKSRKRKLIESHDAESEEKIKCEDNVHEKAKENTSLLTKKSKKKSAKVSEINIDTEESQTKVNGSQQEISSKHASVQQDGKVYFKCFNCNRSDHLIQDCESLCRYCHKKTHIKRDCPWLNKCRNCHRIGHISLKCEEKCNNSKCKDINDGHKRRDCRKGSFCYNCYECGHFSSECEKECTFCIVNYDGHTRKDCKGIGNVCLACWKFDHKTLNCLLLKDKEVVKCCNICLSPFHSSKDCNSGKWETLPEVK